MSPLNWVVRIQDILDAILEIKSFIHNMTFQEFISDTKQSVRLNLILSLLEKLSLQFRKMSKICIRMCHGI